MKKTTPKLPVIAAVLLVQTVLAAYSGLRAAGAVASQTPPENIASSSNRPVVPGKEHVSLDQTRLRARALLERPNLAAYRGWLKFLIFEAETSVTRSGADSAPASEKISRLADWVGRIESNPALLSTLRGVQEWAYESPVDGSGQSFKLMIPTDYDPVRPAPLSVYIHGYSGNHLEHSTGMQAHTNSFEMAVLGRARGGFYVGLSEADVLHAIDYVQSHWNVDPDRVRLNGGSMGGGATLRLGSRYPHRFASGQPTCGYAPELPMANLLTFPLYVTHSADDYVVPILTSRGPLEYLRQLGGQVIFDETNGFGHAVWNYAEGNRRGGLWAERQVRRDSRTVRHLDFTALDGGATRAWWAEIVEWGAAPKPARFILQAGTDNTLYVELSNISRLLLRLAESPFDRAQPLRVSVGGAVPFEVPAPLPETLVLAGSPLEWRVENSPESISFRLHTPGGPLLVYDGSPLLIVYGTLGDAETGKAMLQAAEAASKSPNPGWAADGGEAGADGAPHLQNLYGRLNVKADKDVTETDLQTCNLVLIGTASQNSLVARMAGRLPVRLANNKISCNDGLDVDAANRVLGLVHFNPLAPQRLIFWVASDRAAAYETQDPVPQIGARKFVGADLVVLDLKQPGLVLARSFDSRWRWDAKRAASPLLPGSLLSENAAAIAIADAVRRQAGADFALATLSPESFTPGITRLSDVVAFHYYEPIGIMDISGAEILEADGLLKAASNHERWSRLQPAPEPGRIDPARRYRVALSGGAVGAYDVGTKTAPRSFRMTDLQAGEALERFLIPME
jgi:predicted esterase